MTLFLGALVALGVLFCVAVLLVRSRRDAVAFLTLFAVVLMLIPARLVLPGIGGVGTPANVVGLGLLIWWVAGTMVPAFGTARGHNPVRLGLVVYVGVVLLSYALAPMRPLTDLETSGSDRELIALLAMLGVALFALDGLETSGGLFRLTDRVIALGAVVAGIGMVQFFFQLDLLQYARPPGLVENSQVFAVKARSLFARPYSTTLHPIEFAVVLSMLFPLALTRALANAGRPHNWWRFAAAGTLALSTMMAVSRSGILGLAAAGLVLAVGWSWRARLNAFVGAVIFLGLVRAAVPGLVGTLRNLFLNFDNDPSIQGRLDDVAEVRRIFPEHWLVGRGYGTWNVGEYFVLDNEYYRTLLTTGLLGVLGLFVLLGSIVAALVRVIRTTPDPAHRQLGYGLLAAVAVQASTMATFDALAYPMFTGLLFLTAGLAGALWRINDLQLRTHPDGEAEVEAVAAPVLRPSEQGQPSG